LKTKYGKVLAECNTNTNTMKKFKIALALAFTVMLATVSSRSVAQEGVRKTTSGQQIQKAKPGRQIAKKNMNKKVMAARKAQSVK
jgi:hypothetical protein